VTVLIAGGGTGGHLVPALVLAEAIRKAHPDWRVVIVGARRGIEETLLPARDFPFVLLSAEPIYRKQWWKNLRWPFVAIRLLLEVRRLLRAEHPALVIGTGGYAAGPVVWLAARRGIPTAVLELNAHPGFTVRSLASSVAEIWLGSPEARSHLRPGRRTVVVDTGTPIAEPDPSIRASALARFGLDPSKPVLLVTGGSQGALGLNEVVAEWVGSGRAEGIQVLWVTGRNGYERFRRFHDPPAVQVFDFLDPLSPAYSVTGLALCRAGMMTLAELCAWGIPSILVPLPTAAADHQTSNARAMAQAGAAIECPQSELSPERVWELVGGLVGALEKLATMRRAALARARPGATANILERIGILSG